LFIYSFELHRLRQREFFTFGMDVLMKLDLGETRQFFSAFFNLSDFYWQVAPHREVLPLTNGRFDLSDVIIGQSWQLSKPSLVLVVILVGCCGP